MLVRIFTNSNEIHIRKIYQDNLILNFLSSGFHYILINIHTRIFQIIIKFFLLKQYIILLKNIFNLSRDE